MTLGSFFGQPGRWKAIATVCLVAAVGWKYVHDARLTTGFISREPPGYYGLLTDALRSGRLDLKIQPDPRLLRLANPYAGPQGANRPHDMSFYRGKFYLYYGVTPVLILMLPWRILTGTFLSEMAATTIFCYGGFLLGAGWLLLQRRRFYPGAAFGWTLLAIAIFGFGSPVFALSANAEFYSVPITAAFFCLMVVVVLVDSALRATRPAGAAAWLAAASLMHGLAVGARPDYVLGVGLLLLPAAWLWRQMSGESRRSWSGLRVWLAAIVPAAVVGALLALYNYRRFGSPFEFGIQYSMASGDLRGAPLLGPEFIGKNLKLYLTKAADFIPFYPFVYTNERPFGVLPHLPLAMLALLFPLALIRRPLRRDPRWTVGGGYLLGSALLNLAVLCLFFGGEMRYLVDFIPPALLLAGAMLPIIAGGVTTPPWLRRLVVGTVATMAVWTLANGTCLGLEHRVTTAFTRRLEYGANAVVGFAEKLRGVRYGPVAMTVKLPLGVVGQREPLLTTGTLAGTGDIIYILYTDAGHVQIGFFHLGIGGPISEPMAVDYQQPHSVVLRLGSLYPPRQYPMFRQWSDAEVARLRRQLEVTIDGRSALQAAVDVYPTTPGGVHVGRNPLAPDVCRPRFTGSILQQHRLGVTKPAAPDPTASGPVRLRLRFPSVRGGPAMPLICTGHNGAGDLLSLQVLQDGRVRFRYDSWGNGETTSDPIKTDLTGFHVLDVQMGGLYPPGQPAVSDQLRHQLAVWLDDQLVFSEYCSFNPSPAQDVVFGYNAIGASSAVGMFTGAILHVDRISARTLPPARAVWGPVALTIGFPSDLPGYTEPLLTTGVPGASDIIYVHYVDHDHLRVGLDHWGHGTVDGAPVAIDYSRPHELQVIMGSLYPPDGDEAWKSHSPPAGDFRRLVEVHLDGRLIFSVRGPLYPTAPHEVKTGRNDVTATSCLQTFSGQIIDERRLPW